MLTVFGLVDSPFALLIIPFSFFAGVLFSSMALVVTAHAPSFWTFNYAITLGVMPMYFFGGVFFPLDRYPDIVGTLAWLLPLTPYVHIVRELVTGSLTLTKRVGRAVSDSAHRRLLYDRRRADARPAHPLGTCVIPDPASSAGQALIGNPVPPEWRRRPTLALSG